MPARLRTSSHSRIGNRGKPQPKRPLERFRIQTVAAAGEHFGERLGLFVTIVLGEGVVLIVDAASESALDATTAVAGLVGFVLIATIFVLGLVAGHAGVPLLDPDKIAPRHLVLLHALTTATITALAAGLVHVIDLGLEPAPKAVRWLLRGTVALYLAVELGTAAMTRAIGSAGDKRWAG